MNIDCIKPLPILIPSKNVDLHKWAVIACDQFTSQKSYWDEVEKTVGNAYSTYHLTLPEIYLQPDNSARINAINGNMRKYLSDGIFESVESGMILVTRSTSYGNTRKGLITCVDLDAYSWRLSDKALIRATEGTVLDRIYPRVEIRKDAVLELPHILMLIDDDSGEVFGEAMKNAGRTLYDFDLNLNGGHINGREVNNTNLILSKLYSLVEPDTLQRKYSNSEDKFLMAVGDGNHSLASAKEIWERIKSGLTEEEKLNHPARFALIEIENIYDEGIVFEPIHRVIFNVQAEDFIIKFSKSITGDGESKLLSAGKTTKIRLPLDAAEAVETVGGFLESYIKTYKNTYVDYIHGEKDVEEITAANPGSVGIILPKMNKSDLFKRIAKGNLMPKKTFSMGEATEKRYYLEVRKIVK